MVSPLSSRIYNLEAKANIKNYTQTNQGCKQPWQIEGRRKRISGYVADRESPSLAINPEKQFRAEQVKAHAKKRKVEEQNFIAYNVKADLANAGVEFSPRSRALPEGSIDMSNVELITSSQYSSNKASQASTCTSDNNYQNHVDVMSSYVSLFDSCKEYYKGNRKNQKVARKIGNKAPSTTSSTTVGTSLSSSPCDSDDEIEGESILTPSSLPAIAEKVNVFKNSNAICDFLSSSKNNLITLNKALMICDSARLIIEAKVPHTIVHSNAAFSRLSGISSARLMGSSLSEFIGEILNHTTADILLSNGVYSSSSSFSSTSPTTTTTTTTSSSNAAAASVRHADVDDDVDDVDDVDDTDTLNGNEEQATTTQEQDKIMTCKIVVFQVVSKFLEEESSSPFSHFVLDFEKLSRLSSSSSSLSLPSSTEEDRIVKTTKAVFEEKNDFSNVQENTAKKSPSYVVG